MADPPAGKVGRLTASYLAEVADSYRRPMRDALAASRAAGELEGLATILARERERMVSDLAKKAVDKIVGLRPRKPIWKDWRHMMTCQLWEAVALASDLDPNAFAPGEGGRLGSGVVDPGTWKVPESSIAIMGKRDRDRMRRQLRTAVSHLGIGLRVVESAGIRSRTVITLPNYVEWSRDMGFDLPEGFPWQGKQKAASPADKSPVGWPWGKYETKLLRELAEAARVLWSNYDPRRPRSAPTNEKVIEWLMTRGVSERSAQAIAKILHADDLPPGPRKI